MTVPPGDRRWQVAPGGDCVSVLVAPLLETGAASTAGSVSRLPSGMTKPVGEKAGPRKRACLR